MKPLPITPDLLRVARRVVWFKEPEEALAEPAPPVPTSSAGLPATSKPSAAMPSI